MNTKGQTFYQKAVVHHGGGCRTGKASGGRHKRLLSCHASALHNLQGRNKKERGHPFTQRNSVTGHYRCMSRVVDGRFIFGDREKAYFRKVMRGLEHLTGVRVVTY